MRHLADNRGLTLLETLAASVITALLAVAIGSAAQVILSADREGDTLVSGTEVGLALLREIAALPFDDPQNGGTTLGPEAGEWNPPTDRSLFDDVDDYAVWDTKRDLQTKDGGSLKSPLHRLVKIDYVNRANFNLTSVSPTDYKRITVSVYNGSELLDTFITVRVQGGRAVDISGEETTMLKGS